jgi:YesN/AraC family two-component response regulator
LRDLIAEVDWIDCVGEAADGKTAISLIDSLGPDLVFLDIEMPEFVPAKRRRWRQALVS